MNKHSTVLDVRTHAGDLILRRHRRKRGGEAGGLPLVTFALRLS